MSDEERVRRLEMELAHVYRHLGLDPADALPTAAGGLDAASAWPPATGQLDPEVVQPINGGKKLQAIKVHRERTGLGLVEAKDAVEELERRYRLG
jgi:ribosomal protein L7/L12